MLAQSVFQEAHTSAKLIDLLLHSAGSGDVHRLRLYSMGPWLPMALAVVARS